MTKQLNNPDAKAVIPCLLVPVQGKNLIVPNVSIAEVVSMIEPVPVADAPDWFLGFINWRGEQLPVVSFELASNAPEHKNSRMARIAVINAPGIIEGLNFFAIVIQGIPRMVRVAEQDVSGISNGAHEAEVMEVKTAAGNATIPNFEFFKARIRDVMA